MVARLQLKKPIKEVKWHVSYPKIRDTVEEGTNLDALRASTANQAGNLVIILSNEMCAGVYNPKRTVTKPLQSIGST
jgi:hypothetical protein